MTKNEYTAKYQPRGLGRVHDINSVQGETLVGDVRDLVLQEMRDAKEALPWTVRSEAQQAEMIERCSNFAYNLVAKVVNLVAQGSNPSIPVSVDQWTVKDGLKVVLKSQASPDYVQTMIDGGKLAFLVFADKEPFDAEREPIQPVRDQPDMFPEDDEAGE